MKRPHSAPSFKEEEDASARGYRVIGGVDEAGRGPLAGPVVAACVVLDPASIPDGIGDSKTLTEAARSRTYEAIRETALGIGVGSADVAEIDALNILRATHLAMRRACEACPCHPEFVLVDGLPVPSLPVPHRAIVRGDATCFSIAAASIVAKVTRDRLMIEMDAVYPGYGFADHKGYATPDHLRALDRLGPCPAHRRSFAPVRASASLVGSLLTLDGNPRHTDGERGERFAQLYLERAGHTILATHYRLGHYEVDIVSRSGETVVFTEVKTSGRLATEPPSSRLSADQKKRIIAAATAYLSQHGLEDCGCRFDVIEVVLCSGSPAIRHHEAAFEADGADFP